MEGRRAETQEERQEERQAKMREMGGRKTQGVGSDKKGEREIHKGAGEMEKQTETRQTHRRERQKDPEMEKSQSNNTMKGRSTGEARKAEREGVRAEEKQTKQGNKYLEETAKGQER